MSVAPNVANDVGVPAVIMLLFNGVMKDDEVFRFWATPREELGGRTPHEVHALGKAGRDEVWELSQKIIKERTVCPCCQRRK